MKEKKKSAAPQSAPGSSLGGKERDANLDLIRVAATLLVVSVHFFLNSGFYPAIQSGSRMLVATMIRMAFMTCVPMFIMLTGHLCRGKTLTARYYLGLVRVVLTYALCGILCFSIRVQRGEALTAKDLLHSLLNYSAAPYAWYIEMYIGLFLMIPFLNLMWKGIKTRQGHRALVFTFLALTTIPVTFNFKLAILPDWWQGIYPLAYYFMGAYIGEYQPRPDWRWLLPAYLATAAVNGGFAFWYFHGDIFPYIPLTDWSGPLVVLSSYLLYLLLRQIPAGKAPQWLRWLLRKGSELSLAAYLLSWIFDSRFYPELMANVAEFTDRLVWLPVMVGKVFLCSMLAAQLVDWVRMGVTWFINMMLPKAKLKVR